MSGGTAESAHITVTITGQQQTSEEGTAVEASPTATTTRPPLTPTFTPTPKTPTVTPSPTPILVEYAEVWIYILP